MMTELSPEQSLILVVEDSDECAATMEIALGGLRHFSVRLARTAEEALQVLESSRVSGVITDIHLPAMDGFELLSRLRADARHSNIPIIVISGDADPATPALALSRGASAYFCKPYSPLAVRRKVEELIHAK